MRQEHRCAPSRQRTRPRRPAVGSALCPGCPWPWQCARGRTKTWDAVPAPLSPAMPLPLWCAGEVVQRALARAPRPGRQTAFARRSHHRHRCVGACGSGAGGVVGRAPRLRARSGETRFCGCLGFLGFSGISGFFWFFWHFMSDQSKTLNFPSFRHNSTSTQTLNNKCAHL